MTALQAGAYARAMTNNNTATLAPFGPLRAAWTVDTHCPDCLHAAYTAAINAQDTGETTVAVRHGNHAATATA